MRPDYRGGNRRSARGLAKAIGSVQQRRRRSGASPSQEAVKIGGPENVALERFDPGPHLHFPRPGAAWLAQHVPVIGGDRIRVEHGVRFVFWLGPRCAANAAVDHEMRDVDAVRRQFAGHALRKAAQCELAHRKGGRVRIALHARRCAGKKNGAMPVWEHAARGLLRHQKASKRADGDGLRNIGRDQIDQCAARATACVIDDDVRRAGVALDRGKQLRDIVRIDRITGIGRGAGFLAKRAELVRMPGCQRNTDALASKKPRQGRAQARAGTDDQGRFIFFVHELPMEDRGATKFSGYKFYPHRSGSESGYSITRYFDQRVSYWSSSFSLAYRT